jgi:hypothetical protein
LVGSGSLRWCELVATAAMADRRAADLTHGRRRGRPFIDDADAQEPRFEAKPSRRFNAWVRRPWRACAAGGSTAPRRARAHRVAHGLTVQGSPSGCVRGRHTPSARPIFEARPWYGGAQRRHRSDSWTRACAGDIAPARSRPRCFACVPVWPCNAQNFQCKPIKPYIRH